MEVLQFLKQSYKRDLLNFTTDWLVSEDSLVSDPPVNTTTASDPPPRQMHGILATADVDHNTHLPRLKDALTEELARNQDSEDVSDDDWAYGWEI